MLALAYSLGVVASALQLVGVALVFLDFRNDRKNAADVLAELGKKPDFPSYGIKDDVDGYKRDAAIAELVGLKEWLSTRLNEGLGHRVLATWLVIIGIALDIVALSLAFVSN